MIRGLESVLIGTENAKKLAAFYRNTVGLKQGTIMENPDTKEEGYTLMAGKVGLYVMDHSKIKGKSKEPARVMFNLEVDDIEKEVKRLKKAKIKVIADTYHVPGYGLIATFQDPDGNYFQFVQVRAAK